MVNRRALSRLWIATMGVGLIWSSSIVNAQPGTSEAQPEEELPLCTASLFDDRIVTPEDLEGIVPGSAKPLWVLGWPCRAIYGGMEKGLIAFEKGKVREKLYDLRARLAASGFRPLFGGLGEGSGIGLGTIYDYPHRPTNALHLMGRISPLSGYQDFSVIYDPTPFGGSTFNFVANYQWRPNEPYYGFGQDTSVDDAASFALRQTSFAVHLDQAIVPRVHVGAIYSASTLRAERSRGGPRPSVDKVFGELPGLDSGTSLNSIGAYVNLDGYRGDYRLGGRAQLGASWQENFSGAEVDYTKLQGFIEGRLPIVEGRAILIGQTATDMVRESSSRESFPFYLYPRIGGSATLRGFPLDRFYGRNMILTSLEYRWLLHPRIEAAIFHDSGQIFEHTRDLRFFDWHRNYGFGIRFRNQTGTQFRMELATGDEGFSFHITFGARPLRAFGGGPVRYPLYRP